MRSLTGTKKTNVQYGRKANIRAGRLTNEVITHTHHHPGPGNSAHKEAECRAAVSNRFGIKWRCLTAGGVHVAVFSGSLSRAKRRQGCPVQGRAGSARNELELLVRCIGLAHTHKILKAVCHSDWEPLITCQKNNWRIRSDGTVI